MMHPFIHSFGCMESVVAQLLFLRALLFIPLVVWSLWLHSFLSCGHGSAGTKLVT
jgi:hypothetical protein